jgi:hypothetical protein
MLLGERVGLTKSERQARNSQAFREVIGNPYELTDDGEPQQGHYSRLKNGSGVKTSTIDQMPGSSNPARPNALDFFIDVDAAIADGLNEIGSQLGQLFVNTYFFEIDPRFTQQERANIEQVIGALLRKRSISPVSKYFTTIRK